MSPRPVVVTLACALIFAGAQGDSDPWPPYLGRSGSNGSVWLLGRALDNGSYAVSCEEQMLVALSPDNASVIYYDLKSRTPVTSPLEYPGTSLLLSSDGEQVIVTHTSHVTYTSHATVINLRDRDGNYTILSPVMFGWIVFVAGNLLCVSPNDIAYYYYPDYLYQNEASALHCLNFTKRHWKMCDGLEQVGPIASFLANKNGSLMYSFSYQPLHAADMEYILHFQLQENCIESSGACYGVKFHCGPGACSGEQRAWFSYDASAIFRQHGVVVKATYQPTPDTYCDGDLVPMGYLDKGARVGTYTYRYISQLPENPHTIVALREDNLELVRLYSWPDLTFSKSMAIPKVGTLLSSEEVHYCSADQLYVIATYDTGSAGVQSGIAHL